MSQAKVHRAAKARKEWKCGKCGTTVKVGEPVLSFSVGFRGREQRRCDKTSCYPTRAERESSRVADVYATLDETDWLGASSLEDLQDLLQQIADSMRDVAGEYEASEMFERNPDLQERADILNAAAEDLEAWEPDEQEPDQEDKDSWGESETFEEARDSWLEDAIQSAQDLANGVDLP